MNRSEFLKKTGAGIGATAIMPFVTRAANRTTANETLSPKIMKQGEGEKAVPLGDNMTFKLTGEDTGGAYVLIEQNNEPGLGIPPHVHANEDEIFRVISGQLEVQVGDLKTVLGPGDMVFCPRNIPHTWTVVGDENAIVDLSFFPAGLEEMFRKLDTLTKEQAPMEEMMPLVESYGITFV